MRHGNPSRHRRVGEMMVAAPDAVESPTVQPEPLDDRRAVHVYELHNKLPWIKNEDVQHLGRRQQPRRDQHEPDRVAAPRLRRSRMPVE